MKRLLSLIIALFLVTCNFNVLLYAEETVPVSDIVELDINEEGVERAFTYYSYEDNRHYLVKVYDDKIDVFNADTLEVVLSAERRKGPELSLNQNALLFENMGEQISINGLYDGEDAWRKIKSEKTNEQILTDICGLESDDVIYQNIMKYLNEM